MSTQDRNILPKETGKEQNQQQLPGTECLLQIYKAAKEDRHTHTVQSGKCRMTIRVL